MFMNHFRKSGIRGLVSHCGKRTKVVIPVEYEPRTLKVATKRVG